MYLSNRENEDWKSKKTRKVRRSLHMWGTIVRKRGRGPVRAFYTTDASARGASVCAVCTPKIHVLTLLTHEVFCMLFFNPKS